MYQEWPEELDALIAAPGNHKLVFENETVRVLETSIAPGETTPLHTHRWPCALYIVSSSDYVRRDSEGRVTSDSRTGKKLPDGSTVWLEPLEPHTLENVGERDLRTINVEVKRG